jgi:VCBS repeat-containing protein
MAISPGLKVSINYTPQAVDDSYTTTEGAGTQSLNVLANDLGGAAKTLYAVYAGDLSTAQVSTLLTTPTQSVSTQWGTYTITNGLISFVPQDGSTNALAAGQSVTDVVTYVIRMSNGAFSVAQATVTIAGVNDAVSIVNATTNAVGAVFEDGSLQATGKIAFTDADLIDGHTTSFLAKATNTTALGTFQLAAVNEAAGAADGTVGWTYTLENAKAQYLAAGQQVTETYTVTVDDGHGSTTTQDVTITITGTNDVVSITSGAQAGGVVEDGTLLANGTVTFKDVDLSDGHTASFVAKGTNTTSLGTFQLAPVSEAANAETGSVGWTYTLDNAKAQYLAAGQSVQETYTVTIDDGHGSTTTQDVVITITGTNDVVAIVAGATTATGTVTEDANLTPSTTDALSASGTIAFADVDLVDGHTASVTAQPAAGTTYGTFKLGPVSEAAGAAGGTVGWTYDIDNAAAQKLAAGETVTETYKVTVDDGHGSTVDQNVVITITGTNDVVSVTSGAQTGGVVEDGTLLTNGTITFKDVDLSDGHVVSFVADPSNATALGTFGLGAVSEAANAETGSVGWTYTLDNTKAQYLADGQSVTEKYVVTIDDQHGSTTTTTVTVTIAGTNDLVQITSEAQTGGVAEDGTAQATGTIAFSDVDLVDTHGASFVKTSAAAALGTFSLGSVSESASTEAGTVGWSYTLDNTKAQYLAAGETLTETYKVTVADTHGSSADQTVTVTITGANDLVTIVTGSTTASGTVTEDANLTPDASDSLQATGTIAFTDVDLADGHTASVTAQPAVGTAYGTFTLGAVTEAAGAAGGTLGWTYDIDNAAAQKLAAGETVTETYKVTVDDGHGSTVDQNVVITITGTNDVVEITSGAQAGAVVEDGTQQATGTIAYTDADLIDGHTASVTGQPPADVAYGTFTLGSPAEATGAAGGTVGWTYDIDNVKAQSLAAGQTVTETYTVAIDDGHGSTTTQDVVITITGANDAVEITSESQTGGVVEDGTLSANGTIAFTDVDLIDSHTATFLAKPSNTTALGTFQLAAVSEAAGAADGTVGWTYDIDNAKAQYLAAGQSVQETYTVAVDDGHGSTATQNVVVTITGTNDLVQVTSEDQTGGVVEDGTLLANGTIAFSDADLIDTHGAVFVKTSVPAALGTFSLDSVSESASTDAGTIGWSYTLDNTKAQYLAAGETVTETYEVTVADTHGSSADQTVTITITGTNDAVSIVSGSTTASGTVTEDADVTPDTSDTLQATGTIAFTDADLTDTHSITFAPKGTNTTALGTFSLGSVSESGTTTDGSVGWTYTLDDAKAQYLAAGQSVMEKFTVTVDDGHGSTTTQDVAITITGTNDLVQITSEDQTGGVVEDGAQQATGTVAFKDVDLSDDHTASFLAGDANTTSLGTFELAPVSEAADAETGSVGWSYTLNNAKAQYLADGESVTEKYVVTVDDGHGSTTTQDVAITITGTNDVVEITSGAQTGGVVEDGTLLANGTIDFTDVDLIDGHTASFVAKGTNTTALGTFQLAPVSEAAGAADGTVGWTYTLDNTKAQYLAAGQSATEKYVVTVDDGHGSTTTQEVAITITGTNDAVTITSGNQTGGVVEDGTQQAAGTIGFKDVDLSDTHTASFAADASNTTALGSFALGVVSEVPDAETGSVGWTYDIDNAKAQYLADGQSITETYTVTVSDGHGSTVGQDVAVTITGTNDVVEITSEAQSGEVVEDGTQQASGTIAFTDKDLIDDHTASVTAQPPADDAYGTFTLDASVTEAAGAADGTVGWTYDIDNAKAQSLAAGQSVQETYTVAVDDGHGSTATQNVVITITGTNDLVEITSGVQTGGVAEDGALLANGSIAFSDADLIDTHGAAFVKTSVPAALGTFSIGSVSESADTEAGTVGWSYALDNSKAQYLAAGETVTETYKVAVADTHGSSADQTVTNTITGTNDGVSVTSGSQAGAVVEDGTQQATGSIAFTDADLIDAHSVAFAPDGTNTTALGTFSLGSVSESGTTADGSVGWTYSLDNAQAQYLADGQTVTEAYTVTVDDGHGSTTTQDVVIKITGTNDLVEITSDEQTGAVVEDGTQQATGTVAFKDVDLSDTHTASFAADALNTTTLGTFSLGAVSEAANAETGSVGWTYALDNSEAQYLADGESVTEKYVVTVDDGHGSTTAQEVAIKITGTNDVVSIVAGSTSATGTVTEDANLTPSPSDALSASGTIAFTDVDLADGHTASVTTQPAAGTAYGTFTLGSVTEAAGAAGGTVGWTYDIDNAAAQKLAVGETVIETYKVTVNDGHGSTVDQNVVITITGTNDVVSITSGSQTGNVVEDGTLLASGTIAFTDVDLIDTHSASFAPKGTNTTALGTFSLGSVSESGTTADGTVGWTYTLDNTKAQYLAVGESVTETYTVTIDDGHGSTKAQDVVVTITGTNDLVQITSGAQAGAVVEDGTLLANGTIAFSDADLIDTHGATFVKTSAAAALGTFSLGTVSESASTDTGAVGWSYSLDNAKAQYLAAGETVTETYKVTVADTHGSSVDQTVTITITGTNDVVTIVAGSTTANGTVTEDANLTPSPSDALSTSGTIAFTDVDLADSHTASVTAQPAGATYGTFKLGSVTEAAGAAGGTVGWTYDIDNAAAQKLAVGQSVQETYKVTVDDGHGSTVDQNVVIAIAGTNDIVSVTSGAQTGAVVEDGTLLANGTVAFTDADLIDIHTVSFVPKGTNTTSLGTFSLGSVSESAITDTGTVGWTYTLDNTKAQYLAAGQQVTETYTVTVDDGHGSTTTQDVTITITGTADAVANNDRLIISNNTTATFSTAVLLGNDVGSGGGVL